MPSQRRASNKPIREAAEIDHFIPWARHPDNGIENLVATDRQCNGYKRDFLPAAGHVLRWKRERFEINVPSMTEIAERTSWERHPEQTMAAPS
jgi:5-methylcytosine-specific restriction endonuclease McrA